MLIIINIYPKFEDNIPHIMYVHKKANTIPETSKVNGTGG
jgi:hypothetical protein